MENKTEQTAITPEVMSTSAPRLPSQRIKEIHMMIIEHMVAKEIKNVGQARLMPNCPPELQKVTDEQIRTSWLTSPDGYFSAVLRYLDECYMAAMHQMAESDGPRQ